MRHHIGKKMVFSSTVFLFLFLPIVLLLYFNPIVKSRRYKNVLLLIASLFFYAWGEPIFVFVMMASIVINWYLGIKIGESELNKKRKIMMLIAVGYDLFLLIVFKYFSFITENISVVIHNPNVFVRIALPIGISFFTFQVISYIVDIYNHKVDPQKDILNVGLYICMFPQLIAGPIVRYETIAYEIEHREEKGTDIAEGFTRFVYGLGKKVILANYLGLVADTVFLKVESNEVVSIATVWLGIIVYTMQLYFDFSGYSDMAIGLGQIFGFHFSENFNYPFMASSVSEFWRRWHISLTTWFKDYVYIPLGGSRCTKRRKVLNILIVWALTGMWHGAQWTFIVWGLLFFVIISFEKKTNLPERLGNIYRPIVSLTFAVSLVIFRAENLGTAFEYYKRMLGIGSTAFVDNMFFAYFSQIKYILLIAMVLCTPVVKRGRDIISRKPVILGCLQGATTLLVFFVSVILCVKSTYNPFIYFNF